MTDEPVFELPMVAAGRPSAAVGPAAPDPCTDECCAPVAGPSPATDVVVPDDAVRSVLRVAGMDCASCAVTIEKRVARVPGVHRAAVNFAAGRLDAEHDAGVARLELERAVEQAGYAVERPDTAERVPLRRRPSVRLTGAGLVLFALAGALLAVGVPEAVSSAAFVLAALVGGLPVYRAALRAARTRTADVNVLMTIAVAGAVALGAWSEAALVVLLFSVSNALQVHAVGRTRSAVRALARLTPDEVLVLEAAGETVRPVAEVAVGATVVVRPGERLAVDGTVVDGSSALDESAVTGESTPAEKGPGDGVLSGSLNGAGGLLVRVTKPAGDSTLQRITRMVEEAQGTRAPIERLVDRFSRVYAPAVLVLAVLVAIVPPLLGGPLDTWFGRALVLLIVSCPCALVISTPVSIVSGVGAASRRGILIKGGEALEAAGRLRTLVFDKTGTLTEGRPVVEQVLPLRGAEPDAVLALAAALERRSEHPLAHAILVAAGEADLPAVTGFASVAGRGARGWVDGREVLVGSPRLFEERGVGLGPAAAPLDRVRDAGQTPVVVGDEAGPLAVLGLGDAVRPEARRALDELRAAGVERFVMLTGDAEAPARRVAEALGGMELRAGLLPEDKVAAVRELGAGDGTLGMVGDGVNDAPALAAADVSFAMGAAGTDAALEAADVALMADDLRKLPEAIRLSRAAARTIRRNLAASVVVNTLFTVLAPFGLIPLWLAVLEDAVTSTGVTANSLRLFRAGGRD